MDVSSIASLSGSQSPSSAPLRGAHTPAEQRKAVAGQFEAIMLRQLLSESVGSMVGGEDSAQGSVYGYLMTDVLAQKLSAGGGMGLSKVIERQLTPRGTTPASIPGKVKS